MKTTKTLTLAAAAVLSLGVGAAMADGSGGTFPDYQSLKVLNARTDAARNAASIPTNGAVQSGMSDFDMTGANHSATFILEHHLAGAGGSGG